MLYLRRPENSENFMEFGNDILDEILQSLQRHFGANRQVAIFDLQSVKSRYVGNTHQVFRFETTLVGLHTDVSSARHNYGTWMILLELDGACNIDWIEKPPAT